jgi:tRNA U34 5-methylaminomethyl-2-thiouridine-forming methyltransferase MnmC
MQSSIFQTADGSKSILSGQFGESYHSRHGALQESLHVFIDNGLKFKSLSRNNITILEIGFGTGLNAGLSWYFSEKHPHLQIAYAGIEAYPIDPELIQDLEYDTLLSFSKFNLMHELAWNTNHALSSTFNFLKLKKRFEEMDYDKSSYDIIYFDAFAPACQPELWGETMMAKMYNALRPAGILVTYCAKGTFKRALKATGFSLEKLPGPTGKREMTRATKPH